MRRSRAKRARTSAQTASSNSSGRPSSSATARLVMSSRVGPNPPVVSTTPVRVSAAWTASLMSAGRSATAVRRTTRTPTAARALAISAPLVSTVKPSSSSVPMVTSSRSMGRRWTRGLPRPRPVGKESAVAVEVEREGVDGEQGGDGEGHRDESAVELVPVARELAMLPAHRLPGVTEREPENHGPDEDVLNRGLELPRPGRRNHHPAAAGPPAERGHRDFASNEQQANPERDAAPDGDVVEIVAPTGDEVDRNERGEKQQLVSDRVEQ